MSRLILTSFLCLTACIVTAQLNPQEIDIPMRDGQSLAADLYLPSEQGSFPTILIQTPYNKNLFRFSLPLDVGQNISSSPYAFIILDWRCFYASANACVPTVSRGDDGYDAIEWIAQQDWSNGRVGTWGGSALGNVQFNTVEKHPPHLTCSVPLVASPQLRYEQYFPNGVALPRYLETLNTLFGGAFTLVAQNPYYNLLWQFTESSTYYPEIIDIPMLHIGGWFDHNSEDVLTWFHAIREEAPAGDEQWLLMGPWTHGGPGLSTPGTLIQGELTFPEAQNMPDLAAKTFFDYYLLDVKNDWTETPPVTFFQMGSNTWKTSDVFPPPGLGESILYLRDDNSITIDAGITETQLEFIYDPEDPSPTIGGKTLSDELLQGPYDQAEVESRDDNIIFTSDILDTDVVAQGVIKVVMWVSSDKTDTDFALRITEVYPDGRSIAFGQIVNRMRFLNGYTMDDEELITPGNIYEIAFEFDHLAHTFREGNRIRLIVSSSNYPWFSRNMNNGMDLYPNGNLDTLHQPEIATNRIYMGASHPSRIIFPVEQGLSSAINISGTGPLEMSPNPADQATTLSRLFNGDIIEVRTSTGILVFRHRCQSEMINIPTGSLTPGLYLVTVTTAGGVRSTGKLIVSHP